MLEEPQSEGSKLDRVEQVAKTVSIIAIPVVLAVGGWFIQHAVSQQSVDKDYVQLAVSILTMSDQEVSPSLRKWAVDLMNDKSSVKFDEEVARELSTGALRLPGLAVGRGGVPFQQDFIERLFSEWNTTTELPKEFRAILIEFADAFINERWPEVATFFEPYYYNQQVTFLGAEQLNRRGIVGVMRQFVHEALVGVYDGESNSIYVIDPERIVGIRFVDIIDSSLEGNFGIIRFRLIQDDGTVLETGYEFSRDTYFFIGAVG